MAESKEQREAQAAELMRQALSAVLRRDFKAYRALISECDALYGDLYVEEQKQ